MTWNYLRPWFVFGGSDGTVDISDGERDVFELVPIEMAIEVIGLRKSLIARVEALKEYVPKTMRFRTLE